MKIISNKYFETRIFGHEKYNIQGLNRDRMNFFEGKMDGW